MKEGKLLIKHITSKETSTASSNEYTYMCIYAYIYCVHIFAPRWNMIRNQPNCKQNLCHVMYTTLHN